MYSDLIKYPQITAISSVVFAVTGMLSVPMLGYALSCMVLPLVSGTSVLLGLIGIRASLVQNTRGFLLLSILGTIGALICFRMFFMAWDFQMCSDPSA